ncbi:hypothetical protein EV424DRAFT_1354442 [Suillus variegatus]|nr:hypothetical protein EV424DRAFT_1354442 [Suillus variegatus]
MIYMTRACFTVSNTDSRQPLNFLHSVFRTQSATDMPPAPLTAAWSSEQLEWLEDQNAMYLLAYKTNDLLEFWPSLFDIFFTLWPARSILWPIMPESQALTIEEQLSPMYSEGPTYDIQGTSHASFAGMYPSFLNSTDASLPSHGSTFPMQTSTYADFGIRTSNSFTPSVANPESSLNDGFQVPVWNNTAWNGTNPAWNFDGGVGTPQGGWRLSDLLSSPVSAERSSIPDTLPSLPSPVPPNEDLRPILPSPNAIPSADDSALPSIGKAGTMTSRKVKVSRKAAKKGDGQKGANAKLTVGQAAAKSPAALVTQSSVQHTTKNKKPPPVKPSPSTKTGTQSSAHLLLPGADCGSPNPITNVTSAATMNRTVDTEVRRKRVPIKSRRNDLADAIGTNGVSFLTGKENVLEAEVPSSLKRSGQSEASSAPKKKRAKHLDSFDNVY